MNHAHTLRKFAEAFPAHAHSQGGSDNTTIDVKCLTSSSFADVFTLEITVASQRVFWQTVYSRFAVSPACWLSVAFMAKEFVPQSGHRRPSKRGCRQLSWTTVVVDASAAADDEASKYESLRCNVDSLKGISASSADGSVLVATGVEAAEAAGRGGAAPVALGRTWRRAPAAAF